MQITNQLTEEQRKAVAALLTQRHANEPCPRCRYSEFGIVDSTSSIEVSSPLPAPGNPNVFTKSLKTIVTVCTNCGFVSHHLLQVLDRT